MSWRRSPDFPICGDFEHGIEISGPGQEPCRSGGCTKSTYLRSHEQMNRPCALPMLERAPEQRRRSRTVREPLTVEGWRMGPTRRVSCKVQSIPGRGAYCAKYHYSYVCAEDGTVVKHGSMPRQVRYRRRLIADVLHILLASANPRLERGRGARRHGGRCKLSSLTCSQTEKQPSVDLGFTEDTSAFPAS